MTVLVTGGSGIIGRPLIDLLLARGQRVTALCRHPEEPDSSQLRWLTGDVSKPLLGLPDEEWQQLCREVDSIFHLAARTDFKGKSLEEYGAVNIEGVRHIKELALISGAWLHHVSTAFVCGDWGGEFREDQLQEGQGFHNFYEESKYRGECVLREEPSPQYTVYRPSIVLERRPTAASISVFGPFVFLDGVFRLCLEGAKRKNRLKTLRVEGNPRAHLPFVFNDDVALALADLAEKSGDHGKTYHLTPAVALPNDTLARVFNQAFAREAVAWVTAAGVEKEELTRPEKILSKKTKVYAPYLNLTTTFARDNLEDSLGKEVLPAIKEEDLLSAFIIFLSTKKELDRGVSHDEQFHLERYFTHFLPQYTGKPLIKNLASLSACLQIEIKGYTTWTVTIMNGILIRIARGSSGNFGYTTDGNTFLQVASGKMSPQQGFFQGAIQLVANPREALRTATALEEFFREYPYHFEPLLAHP
ncbi:nucleoside-diphosphate-sugar epimerase [Desulfocapsa sulfexigens DSM 10523]|uniref:Nucleoside-diphosphate-sugar epimerase n=1 Tax=Desulfocapsa sulfexigens (strain DSM 10523 / SB164P1) TaxID=1167006 RepID=M1PCG7_DESSD|nr:SDR family oxidoreductase [Desulfocapsa sulfexigens]AGF77435.1 nucleoside-diphosphate-sugar epimerase [Desulfocapsa sulfexigens DSM 10523]